VHLIEAGGRRVPLDETEYARDGVFAYMSARLVDWAEERSRGFFKAADGAEVPLEVLRSEHGPERLADTLARLAARHVPAVCVPDAELPEDVALVAQGLAYALGDGVAALVRCSPALVGPLAGTAALELAAPPQAHRALIVCGSWVPTTARQVDELLARRPGTLVEVDVEALVGRTPDAEIRRVAARASALLETSPLAVVATPRARSQAAMTLAAGRRLAANLARIVPLVEPAPDVLVAKGGITSAVTLREGLGAAEADVVGPVLPGVSLWRAESAMGLQIPYLVVPGNVGADDLLAELVDLVVGEAGGT
jgi:uncharacterized protein YgbK (DUF1537 family)